MIEVLHLIQDDANFQLKLLILFQNQLDTKQIRPEKSSFVHFRELNDFYAQLQCWLQNNTSFVH